MLVVGLSELVSSLVLVELSPTLVLFLVFYLMPSSASSSCSFRKALEKWLHISQSKARSLLGQLDLRTLQLVSLLVGTTTIRVLPLLEQTLLHVLV